MSCPNFVTQKDFKLFLWDFESPEDDKLNEYIFENGMEDIESIEDITEEMRNKYASSIYEWEVSNIIDNFTRKVNDILHAFKRDLQFFEVILRGGHYCGLQFYVRETHDMSCLDIENLDNEDTRYYFDMCKSEFLRKYNSEMNFINKKLLPKLAEYFGFEEYCCAGVFSNGEAIYCKK